MISSEDMPNWPARIVDRRGLFQTSLLLHGTLDIFLRWWILAFTATISNPLQSINTATSDRSKPRSPAPSTPTPPPPQASVTYKPATAEPDPPKTTIHLP